MGKLSIPTATSREILGFFYPRHEMHSLYCVHLSDEPNSLDLTCSCGDVLVLTKEDASSEGLDYTDIKARLEKLCKFEREKA